MDYVTRAFYDADPQGYSDSTMTCDVSEVRRRFSSRLRPGARVLDLGCGSGRDTLAFRESGFSVVPVDGSEGMCRVAEANTGSEVRRLDILDLDYEGYFDGVWACASVLHLERGQIPGALELVCTALVDGGVLFVSFKSGDFSGIRDGRWYTDVSPDAISDLAEGSGFTTEEVWTTVDPRGVVWTNAILGKPK